MGIRAQDHALPNGAEAYYTTLKARWYLIAVVISFVLASFVTAATSEIPTPSWPTAATSSFFAMFFGLVLLVFHCWWREPMIVSAAGRWRDSILRREIRLLSRSPPSENGRRTVLRLGAFLLLTLLLAIIGWIEPSLFFICISLVGVFSTEIAAMEFRRDRIAISIGEKPWAMIWNMFLLVVLVVGATFMYNHGVAFSVDNRKFDVFLLNMFGAFAAASVGAYFVLGVDYFVFEKHGGGET